MWDLMWQAIYDLCGMDVANRIQDSIAVMAFWFLLISLPKAIHQGRANTAQRNATRYFDDRKKRMPYLNRPISGITQKRRKSAAV